VVGDRLEGTEGSRVVITAEVLEVVEGDHS
jgi:hypothetical protein